MKVITALPCKSEALCLAKKLQSRFGGAYGYACQSPWRFFSVTQRKLVSAIAETIIPETGTPGAIQAGVPGWIELLVQDCFEAADQKIIIDGLADVETRSNDQFQKPYAGLTVAEQIELLTSLENAAKKSGNKKAFIRQFKELTKFTYVNSEVGETQAFDFILVPGRWDPAAALKPGQKVEVL